MKEREKDKRLLVPKDEFGEEAAEGLGRLSRGEAAEDLRELTGRLERRLESSRRRPRRIWLPAAAAVVTVLVASALYVSLFRDRGDGEPAVAMADEKGKGADSAGVAVGDDTVLVAMAADSVGDATLIAMATSPEKSDESRSGAETKSDRRADISKGRAQPTPPPEVAGVDAVTAAVVTDDEVLEVVAEAQREEPGAKKVMAEAMHPPKGQVPAGEEMAVAAVPAAQQEEAVAEEVIVEALPMMQKTALRADDAEKDKTAGKKEAARAAAPGTVRPDGTAMPVGGWEAFNDWTRPNISHAGELTSEITRLVVLAFRVRADSTLYDLKVVRSGDDSYSREALRLLREGPKWTPVTRNGEAVEEEVKISIVFK